MIPVKHDNVSINEPQENCCFCGEPTSYWYVKKDVACCQACARIHKVSEVPSKKEWWARETKKRDEKGGVLSDLSSLCKPHQWQDEAKNEEETGTYLQMSSTTTSKQVIPT